MQWKKNLVFSLPHPAEICCVHCHADDFNESHMHARSCADRQRSHTHLRMLPPLTTNLRNKRATVHRTRLILGPDEDNKSMSTLPTHRHRGYWLGGQPMRKPCVHVFHVRVTIKKNQQQQQKQHVLVCRSLSTNQMYFWFTVLYCPQSPSTEGSFWWTSWLTDYLFPR